MRDPDNPTGRERSSRNALTHGLCSTVLVLPDQSQKECNELFQGWLDEYDARTQIMRGLVARAARAECMLLRASKKPTNWGLT